MNEREPMKRFTTFACEKRPAGGSRAMVVTNHPLASAAGAEMLLGGGNAIDAAVAALFALTVVEPMMVGILGGGIAHIRLAAGRHVVLDGLSTAPAAAHGAMYETVSDALPSYRDTVGRANQVGPACGRRAGRTRGLVPRSARIRLPVERGCDRPRRPARRAWLRGDTVSGGLRIRSGSGPEPRPRACRPVPARGCPLQAGARVVQPEYAQTLRIIAGAGAGALYAGELGEALAEALSRAGGLVSREDLDAYRVIEREPIRGSYRGFEILGPPPPASSGVHVVQMLNLLEGFDVGAMGFGSPDAVHLLAEVMKIAFADRAVATADPAFVDVPVARLTDKAYAGERRRRIDPAGTRRWEPGVLGTESNSTTHVTVADADGNVVASTQTINGLFGACLRIPGTGMIANNYMFNFDPHPGRALSVEPGKRVFTSMAPMMVRRGGRLRYALGLPGGLRIFPSALQAIVNLLDHGMSLQEAVEAPRIWTEGGVVELEEAFPEAVERGLVDRGHEVARLQRIGGGMNAVGFGDDGSLTGAACWRADGTPVAIAGGWPEPACASPVLETTRAHDRDGCPSGRYLRHDCRAVVRLAVERATMTETVVVLDAIGDAVADRLRALLPEGFELTHGTALGDDHLADIIADADYAISGQVAVSGAVLRAGKRLKLLHKWGVGVDNLDVETARELGIKVARTTGANSVAVAEFTMGLMIGALRHIPHGHLELQNGRWRDPRGRSPFLLSGKTVGLVGFGAIARALSGLLAGSAARSSTTNVIGSPSTKSARSASSTRRSRSAFACRRGLAALPVDRGDPRARRPHGPRLHEAHRGPGQRRARRRRGGTGPRVGVAEPCDSRRRGRRIRDRAPSCRQPLAAHRQPHPHAASGRHRRGHVRTQRQADVRQYHPGVPGRGHPRARSGRGVGQGTRWTLGRCPADTDKSRPRSPGAEHRGLPAPGRPETQPGVVESRTGAPVVGSGGDSAAFASGLSPAPLTTFPVPAHQTGRADFPHPAFGRDHTFALGRPIACRVRVTRP